VTHSIWERWNSSSTSTTAYYDNNETIWIGWNTTASNTETVIIQPQRVMSEEEIREAKRQAEVERERFIVQQKEAEQKRKEAEKRAKKLLMESLTAKQLERFLKDECIPIDSIAGRKYLIRKGKVRNIDVVDGQGKVACKLCAHPTSVLCPDYDVMLAQKLMLENCEEDFLKIANRSN
jgi:hypothetical protein